jgi:ketosteroid isomerase-like protein
MSESNAVIARRGYEAIARGDVDAIADLLHPDVKWHGGDPTATDGCVNRAQVLTWMRRRTVPRGVAELVEVVDAGDQVVVIMRWPADGDEPSELIANLTTFRDGKVVEMVHYPDPNDALTAAGVVDHPRL